ncbi:metal ABC transporter permease [Spirochaeta dissipatitropha]
MMWTSLDTWIVVAGILAGASCALTGAFLVLKKVSMMGDAISHSVLPGIAIAFIITGSRSSTVMLIGAGAIGLLSAFLVELVQRHGKLEHGASLGVVFTILFAIGLILIEQAARHVDIHPEHVLYGAVELVPLYTRTIAGFEIPEAVLRLGLVLLLNSTIVILLFKEFRISTFDPALASTLGISGTGMHYLLMAMTAVTTVAAFEAVGSILVIGMLIVPGACAHLLTKKLVPFVLTSVFLAAIAAVFGHIAAISIPPVFGFEDTSSSGSMTTILGIIFILSLICAPEYGLVAKAKNRMSLKLQIAQQDILGLLARNNEQQAAESKPVFAQELIIPGISRKKFRTIAKSPFEAASGMLKPALLLLQLKSLVRREAGKYALTDKGTQEASRLLRLHRLWELYFFQDGGQGIEELHQAADLLEHYTDEQLQEALSSHFSGVDIDPQGKNIPE